MKARYVAGIAAASASLLTFGGFGIAQAVTTIPPNTLHGCVTGSTRTLEHVYTSPTSGTTCPSGFQVIWPSGADSDPAPESVTAGPGGLDEQVVQDPAGGTNSSLAQCPLDHPYILGGGYRLVGTAIAPVYSNPIAPNPPFTQGNSTGAWAVYTGSGGSSQVYAYAICSK